MEKAVTKKTPESVRTNEVEKEPLPLTAPLPYGGESASINSMRKDRLVHLIRHNAKPQNFSGHCMDDRDDIKQTSKKEYISNNMTQEQLKKQFQEIEDNFNKAVITNDINEIKKCITSDWALVDSQCGIIPQERFFSVPEQGLLSHSTMTKEILRVKIYGDIALVTGRGQNTGTWQGQPMEADEWITDVYKKENEKWLCVLTHLTPVKNIV
ncbi:MAG: nuclear transport factor 2 family protein [Melioribacteraceae bacterium]